MKTTLGLCIAVMAISFASPQVAKAMRIQNQNAIVQNTDDKFKEVKVTDLPEAVTKSISTAYTGSKIDKAYMGDDNSYKVKVSMGELKYNLFYDAKGDLIKVEEPTGKSKTDMSPMNDNNMDPANKTMDPGSKSTTDPASKSMDPSKKATPTPNKTY